MGTITIAKDTSTLVYDDYYYAKAALRLAELTDAIPYQKIVRRKDLPAVQCVLTQPAWYTGRVAAYQAVQAATFAEVQSMVADDYLGNNLSTMADLINGRAQVPAEVRRVVEAGSTGNAFRTYVMLDSVFSATENTLPNLSLQDYLKKYGSNPLGFLLHPALYAALSNAPQASGYSGTGNGTISVQLKPGAAISENLTFTTTATAPGGGTFSVVGSTSGSYAPLTVGTRLETSNFYATITAGSVDFVNGDHFTVVSVAAPY